MMQELQSEYLCGARRKAPAADYFDAEDSGDEHEEGAAASAAVGVEDDEVDPLDAFMQGIIDQVTKEQAAPSTRAANKPQVLKHEVEDTHSYLEDYARGTKKARVDLNVDSDEEVYAAAAAQEDNGEGALDLSDKKVMEVLTPVDHALVQYEPFRKAFYTPHRDTAALSEQQVADVRLDLGVKVHGLDAPAPVRSFVHLGFDRKLLQTLMKLELEAPTAIQAQAFPVALSGRDLIGIAKTGSGKTLAFTLPMVRHVMAQRELLKGEGPIAVVLAPTRELAHQTYVQAKKFLAVYGASCAAIYGGAGKWEQVLALKKGAEVVVATPGRLIEMIRKKTAPMNRVTFVVLDEADRMFEMGFEPQLRSILGQIRPDRQTLMFSATFRRRVEALALDVLTNPVKLVIGQVGQANEDIRQIAVVLPGHGAKWPWLMSQIRGLVDEGRLLIFAGSKVGCEELAKNLATVFPAAPALCLHGDKTQQERAQALAKFKRGECRVLVATDVAARGLDVKDVKNVVNFDVAKTIDTHVHRIGRTGRMGLEGFEPGTAYTLVTRNEAQFAAQLVYNMDISRQAVSPELLALAKRDERFRRGANAVDVTARDAGRWHSTSPEQQHVNTSTVDEGGAFDAEDAVELERWNDNRRKSKSDQRKGLGFAGDQNARATERPAQRRGFVKASAPATSLATMFRSGFVKSSLKADASSQPLPSKTAFVSSSTPPLLPAVQRVIMNESDAAVNQLQHEQFATNAVATNEVVQVSPLSVPTAVVSTSSGDTRKRNEVDAAASSIQQHGDDPHGNSVSPRRVRKSQSRSRARHRRRSSCNRSRLSSSRSRSRSKSRLRRRRHSRSRSDSSESYRRNRRRSPSYNRRRQRSSSSDRSNCSSTSDRDFKRSRYQRYEERRRRWRKRPSPMN
uniref:RNA helicase n=1 Tax=Hyaloperonospora arabidopsidis (strain Emoy2) TaxID=559515 RepID=M4B230_HYAAE